MGLLGKAMPYQVHMKSDVIEHRVYETVEEVRADIIKHGLQRLLPPDNVVIPMRRKT